MRPRQMNPRQRQGLLLVVLACVGLLGVFLLIANYVSGVSRQVGPKTQLLRLVRSVPPYQPVTANDLGETSVPRKWAPARALTDPTEAVGLVSQVPLSAGTELQQGMLTQRPALPPGDREIAIMVDPETGVAGQITPGELVDIVATFQGSTNSTGSSSRNVAQVVVPGAEVLNVGQIASNSSSTQGETVPITFALSPTQVLKVSYAESFAEKVRLSIVAPGSRARSVSPSPYRPRP